MLSLVNKLFGGVSVYAVIIALVFSSGVISGYKAKSYFVQRGEIRMLQLQHQHDKEVMLSIQKYAAAARDKEIEVQKKLETLQNEAQNDPTVVATDGISVSGVRRLNSIK